MIFNDVTVMAIIVALTLAVLHYWPWRHMLGGDLPRPAAYSLGVLAMLVPVCILLAGWEMWRAVWAIVIAVVVGGTTVLMCYGIDWIVITRARLDEAREREAALREQVIDGAHQTRRR